MNNAEKMMRLVAAGAHMVVRADGRRLPLADGCVDAVVTSPPYFGLRAYATGDAKACEIGTEASVEAYVAALVECAREWWRVLKATGVVWLNLGDTYSATRSYQVPQSKWQRNSPGDSNRGMRADGVTDGQLLMVPARVALALQADGWIVRSDVVWAKRNAMPESVAGWRWERCRVKVSVERCPTAQHHRGDPATILPNRQTTGPGSAAEWQPCPGCDKCRATDGMVLRRGSWRPTRAHEAVFMLAKSPRYYANGEAVRVAARPNKPWSARSNVGWKAPHVRNDGNSDGLGKPAEDATGANLRSVWRLASKPAAFDFCARCRTFHAAPSKRPERVDGVKQCRTCTRRSNWRADEHKPGPGITPGDWVDHFALMPPRLAELCILTTPERVCSTCGAPWARVVERSRTLDGVPVASLPAMRNTDKAAPSSAQGIGHWRTGSESRTLGHRPTCRCAAPHRPALILDPFAGGGTTGAMAGVHGRRFVGLDLSHRYALLATARIAHAEAHPEMYLQGKGAVEPGGGSSGGEQLSLFGGAP